MTESEEPLGERARAMIEFEAHWFTFDEDRHDTIRARFACSVEDYNLELNRVIDHPGALAIDPLVVRRLRRLRERRRRARIDGTASANQGGHA
ncbi:MAG: hypothetical protein JWM12_3046 [Ilumatobacteraceae bacterium]|nr:hypothetical protein [Ilumatobacteraceae bacterium]